MKEKFIKSTIILIIGGLIIKILSMVTRVITTRIIGLEGIGLYMLILPTYGLFITIATLSLPIAISKLVSEDKRNNKNVVLGIIPLAIIFNILIIIILIVSSDFIANTLLKNNELYYPIVAMAITLPFITLSSIIRGYFFGKERMVPHVISNLCEQLVRLALIIIITPYLLEYGLKQAITGIVLFNVISELFSVLILLFFIPKNIKIKKRDIKPEPENIKDIISISVPTTAGRIITAFGSFLEPIIITFVLLSIGYTNDYITKEYGMISGFVFPILMLPQFLSSAIGGALLPTISKYNSLNQKKAIKRKLYQACIYSGLIGIIFTIIIMIFPEESLKIMFNDTRSAKYLLLGAPIFLLTYIEGPIISALQAIDRAKVVMASSIIGIIIKTIILFILLYLDIDMYALLIAIFFQYFIIIIYQIFKLKSYFK